MPIFSLSNFAPIHQALNSVSRIHGAYRAVEILGNALEGSEESADFEDQLRGWTGATADTYEGPENTTRLFVKGIRTASNTSNDDDRNALLQLLSLVLSKLTVSQGTRVIAILLKSVGLKPALLVMVIKMCALAAGTRTGRRIVEAAKPQLQKAVAVASNHSLTASVQELAASLGERGADLLSGLGKVAAAPVKAAQSVAEAGIVFLDQLKPVNKPEADKQG